ncbi:uncharacterized protein LOC143600440 [Bidens hawaiensis]|uniref:uncharacterized protein LOC143600440 n=1 Tax=Bidens hawaiensis TaxID=980011 RepID=UPI00404A43E0
MEVPNTSLIQNITIDSLNPLYLHLSNHPGMILVSKYFDGNGFGAWKRATTIALSAKNKIGFINNTVNMPTNQPYLALLKRCNDIVKSWILNTLNHDIRDSVLYAETAQILWNELNSRYSQANSARDELNAINSIPSCACGAAHAFAKREEDQRLIQFLVGLNPSYDMIRSNILMMQPLPSIDNAYGILIQEENTERNPHHHH